MAVVVRVSLLPLSLPSLHAAAIHLQCSKSSVGASQYPSLSPSLALSHSLSNMPLPLKQKKTVATLFPPRSSFSISLFFLYRFLYPLQTRSHWALSQPECNTGRIHNLSAAAATKDELGSERGWNQIPRGLIVESLKRMGEGWTWFKFTYGRKMMAPRGIPMNFCEKFQRTV